MLSASVFLFNLQLLWISVSSFPLSSISLAFGVIKNVVDWPRGILMLVDGTNLVSAGSFGLCKDTDISFGFCIMLF